MVDDPGTIAKLRRIQIGLYSAHTVLLSVGLILCLAHSEWITTALLAFWLFKTALKVVGPNSTLRTPLRDLVPLTVGYNGMRWRERATIIPLGLTVVAQVIAVGLFGSWKFAALIFLGTLFVVVMLLPNILIAYIVMSLTASERRSGQYPLISVVFVGYFVLQFLALSLLLISREPGMLFAWTLIVTGVVKDRVLFRKREPALEPVDARAASSGSSHKHASARA